MGPPCQGAARGGDANAWQTPGEYLRSTAPGCLQLTPEHHAQSLSKSQCPSAPLPRAVLAGAGLRRRRSRLPCPCRQVHHGLHRQCPPTTASKHGPTSCTSAVCFARLPRRASASEAAALEGPAPSLGPQASAPVTRSRKPDMASSFCALQGPRNQFPMTIMMSKLPCAYAMFSMPSEMKSESCVATD